MEIDLGIVAETKGKEWLAHQMAKRVTDTGTLYLLNSKCLPLRVLGMV